MAHCASTDAGALLASRAAGNAFNYTVNQLLNLLSTAVLNAFVRVGLQQLPSRAGLAVRCRSQASGTVRVTGLARIRFEIEAIRAP